MTSSVDYLVKEAKFLAEKMASGAAGCEAGDFLSKELKDLYEAIERLGRLAKLSESGEIQHLASVAVSEHPGHHPTTDWEDCAMKVCRMYLGE